MQELLHKLRLWSRLIGKRSSDFSYVLKPHQIADGAALACQTRLKTDVVVRLGK
ncbi:MAG: hypothetical protein WA733_23175 [Methylocystis sp.]